MIACFWHASQPKPSADFASAEGASEEILTILARDFPRMTRFAAKNVVESYLNVLHIGQRRFAASRTQCACTSDIGRVLNPKAIDIQNLLFEAVYKSTLIPLRRSLKRIRSAPSLDHVLLLLTINSCLGIVTHHSSQRVRGHKIRE